MLYLYDNAIAKDIQESIDPSCANDIVRIIDKEGATALVAQIKEDKIKFPIVCLVRNADVPIDASRSNFTRSHVGVPVCLDKKENNIYFEKAIPVKLGYDLTVLATNTADVDEIVRELLFKYSSMYFLTIQLPYESGRKIRFGVSINPEVSIKKNSGSYEYIKSGALYETIIPLYCEGAVMVSYTPRHVTRCDTDISIEP